MADDGLQYSTDMTDLTTKSNRKMILIGNSTQLTSITTYPGQIIYTTTTGGAFTINNYYKRNAANNAWSTGIDASLGTESAELTNTPDFLPKIAATCLENLAE